MVSGAFLYEMELFEYLLDGLPLRTGDIVATVDGTEVTFRGQVWRLVGAVMPGDIHHVLMYVGPGPRFIEAGPSGVIEFEMPESRWDSVPVADSRGGLMDRLHGVACPLFGKRITGEREAQVRRAAADYCLAQVGKPYNRRFSDPYREDSFYCSQLLWRAYRRQGINLRARGVGGGKRPGRIIFPSDVWRACLARNASPDTPVAPGEAEAPSRLEAITDHVAEAVEGVLQVVQDRVADLEQRVEAPETREAKTPPT